MCNRTKSIVREFGSSQELARTVRSSSKASNPTFQPLIGSQEPTPEVLVPVINLLSLLRPTPANREIVFHSESGICTIVSQRCFTTRNLRTKLCGIRSQTQKQEFVDPFKSWYLETRSDSEMENRLACGKHFSHKRLN